MSAETDAALISGSAQLASTAAGAISGAQQNRKQREWSEMMYGRQRADSLSDWTMQNEYNSPTSQMARLREAGLNPNLVYGKGADNTSTAVRSSQAPAYTPQRLDFSGIGRAGEAGLMAYYDVQMKQAQIDNLKVQNTVALQEKLLKEAQTEQTKANTDTQHFDLDLKQSLRDTSIDYQKESLRKLEADTEFTLDQNERQTLLTSNTLQQGMEDILTKRLQRAKTGQEIEQIRQTIQNLKLDATTKKLDNEMREKGIQPSDNIAVRLAGRLMESNAAKSAIKTAKDGYNATKNSHILNPFTLFNK